MTATAYLKQELGADWVSAPGLSMKDKMDLLAAAKVEMAARDIPLDVAK